MYWNDSCELLLMALIGGNRIEQTKCDVGLLSIHFLRCTCKFGVDS